MQLKFIYSGKAAKSNIIVQLFLTLLSIVKENLWPSVKIPDKNILMVQLKHFDDNSFTFLKIFTSTCSLIRFDKVNNGIFSSIFHVVSTQPWPFDFGKKLSCPRSLWLILKRSKIPHSCCFWASPSRNLVFEISKIM